MAHRTSTCALNLPHPYARLHAKKDDVKRRKIWNHALEKSLFTPYELSTMGAPQRRTIYIASLEAHIDLLHDQLDAIGCCPAAPEELAEYRGLNSKTAKSLVAGLQYSASIARLKLLEIQRANENLVNAIYKAQLELHPETRYDYSLPDPMYSDSGLVVTNLPAAM